MKNKLNYKKINEICNLKIWSIISFISYFLIQVVTLVPPLIMQKILDEYVPEGNLNKIIFSIILFVSIPCIYLLAKSIFNYLAITFARNKGNEIAIKILKNIVYQPISYFDKQNSMELLSYSSKEATSYLFFHMMEKPQFYANILLSIFILLILSRYSIILAMVQLLFIPFAFLPNYTIGKKLQKNIDSVLIEQASLSQARADIFKGISQVKLFRLEDNRIKQIENINGKIASKWGKIAALDESIGAWNSNFLTRIFTAISFSFLSYILLNQSTGQEVLAKGAIVSILSYLALLYASFVTIFQTKLNDKKNDAEFARLFDYLDMSGELEKNRDKQDFELNDKISIENVDFSYSDKVIFKNLNMVIEKGKWTGLVGHSGAGKSTLFKLLLTLYDYQNGNIKVDDKDLKEISSFSLRDKLSLVSQDIFFFPGTIRDNLLLVNPELSDEDIHETLAFVNLTSYVEKLDKGIDTEIGEAGKLMSGGERQRLSLAQALLRKNKILLLDEITANIDKETENEIKNKLAKLLNEQGYTIVSISHNDEFLTEADRIYKIENKSAQRVR